MSFIEKIEQLDRNILFAINDANSPFLDQLMWWISKPSFGIPFYIIFALLLFRYFGWKNAMIVLVGVGVAVALSDLSAKYLFKEMFERYRPSHNLEIQDQLHYVNDYRGGMYGFVSSHAANMFAIASVIWMALRKKLKYFGLLLLVWAGLIAYSRVYLGVHYPSDVFVGALLGVTIGWLVFSLLNKMNLLTLEK